MAAPLAPVELIERSRRGEPVDAASVEAFVHAWLEGTAADALMSAWCMVACLPGIDRVQTEALARALVASGDRLVLGSLGPTGDPQSTGGVGDTTALVAAPLAASLGVRVASVGGRALGHMGGTVDKLEAIPGFQAELPLGRFVRQVRDVGIAVTAHGSRLAPGDRRLRELRDATGTVPSAALVAASVMSAAISAARRRARRCRGRLRRRAGRSRRGARDGRVDGRDRRALGPGPALEPERRRSTPGALHRQRARGGRGRRGAARRGSGRRARDGRLRRRRPRRGRRGGARGRGERACRDRPA